MSHPLWVLDTNVLISAAITPDGVCATLIDHAVSGAFTPAWTPTILREYRDVLRRPRFRLSKAVVRGILSAMPDAGRVTPVRVSIDLPDVDDLPFVQAALGTEERLVITGNPRHFPSDALREFDVAVLSPREALDRLEAL